MKSTACAIGLAALALAGCAPTESPVASAPASYVGEPRSSEPVSKSALHARIAHFARLYNIPESLIHRSVRRESNYNPGARNGPYWGLMQIRHDTAKGMGYNGSPAGLLDADTNMTYAVPYLANAYKLSGGDEARAIQLYAGGYYYEAKRRGMLNELHKTALSPHATPVAHETSVAANHERAAQERAAEQRVAEQRVASGHAALERAAEEHTAQDRRAYAAEEPAR